MSEEIIEKSGRVLAHVEKIISLDTIPGADKIEVVTVLGWHCVVNKDEFKVGDLALYIETDSIVPKIEYFAFMLSRKYRVKIIKLKKQISEGLLISLPNVENCLKQIGNKIPKSYKEGDDLTELMGIVKYESQSDRESNTTTPKKRAWHYKYLKRFKWYRNYCNRNTKGWPGFIKRTDEERIQNLPFLVKDKSKLYYLTEKLEGQSGTWWFKKLGWFVSEFGICSHNVRKSERDNSNWSQVAKIYNLKQILKDYYKKTKIQLAIQGEVIGPGIQKNIYKLSQLDFYIFNIINIKTGERYSLDQLRNICFQLNLKMVPVLGTEVQIPDTVDDIIKWSVGDSKLLKRQREGIVWRTYDQSISFKAVNPEYLLKQDAEDSKSEDKI